MSGHRAFIIWTLQRTGGTQLARRLFERASLLEAARQRINEPGSLAAKWLGMAGSQWNFHEPFNYGKKSRIFGPVTERWVNTRDRKALDAAVGEICSLRISLKHCVEMVPWEVSESLVDATCRNDYRHLFLYRRNAVNRLLSLHFARQSGIWGPHFRNENELRTKIFDEPLPVRKLVHIEDEGRRRLARAWKRLVSRGATPSLLAFEDVFEAGPPVAAGAALLPVLEHLALRREPEEDAKFVAETIASGEQGTREEYASFRGIERLASALEDIAPFSTTTRWNPLEPIRRLFLCRS
jgi:hypothetical protein